MSKNGNNLGGMTNVAFHEVGHNLGFRDASSNSLSDPMSYTGAHAGANFSRMQLINIHGYATSDFSNRGANAMMIINKQYYCRAKSTNENPYSGMRKPRMIIPKPLINPNE